MNKSSCGLGLDREYQICISSSGKTLVGRTSPYKIGTIQREITGLMLGMIDMQGVISVDRKKILEGTPVIYVKGEEDIEKVVNYFGFEEMPKERPAGV